MKNIFRVLSMLLMAMTLSLVTVSCSDDDDEEPAPAQTQGGNGGVTTANIIGTWTETNDWGTDTFTFNADGTFFNTWTEYGKGSDSDSGTYSLSGSILTLKYSYDDVDVYTATISGNTLTLSDGDDSYVYHRVN